MGAVTIDEAMRLAPRADYLPPDSRSYAGEDRPLSIGDGVTNSQPTTVRAMLELLAVEEGDRVLDVGSGSGWTTAIMAHLTGVNGSVVGVELIPRLAREGGERLRAAGLTHTSVVEADEGMLGVPAQAPFDRILVSAAADALPEELVDQLADGGRLVIPVRDRMVVVDRVGDQTRTRFAPGRYRFVPLRYGEAPA